MYKKKKDPKLLSKTNPWLDWTTGNLLGKGTFGEVYMVKNKAGGVAAAKVCSVSRQEDYDDLELEVKILTMCDHQNILKAQASYYWEKKVCMILELCACGALDSVIEKMDGLDEPTIKVITFQVMEGLQYLHKKCVIHRDIKAGNIMLTELGTCKIADFGVSAVTPAEHGRRNTFIGTPYWMAPEAIATETLPHQEYTDKIDIWSAGMTVIEMAECLPSNCELPPIQVMLMRLRHDSPTLASQDRWSLEMNKFIELTLTKDQNLRPSASQCLQTSFLNGDDAKDVERLVELVKMVRAIDQGEEEDVEEIKTEVDLDEPSSYEYSAVQDSTIVESPAAREEPTRPMLRTIKKTIKFQVNGITKTKTIIKVIDNEGKNQKERERSMRSKLLKEMKFVKIAEQREQKKLEILHRVQLSDLLEKQKIEYNILMERYLNETETLTKYTIKEINRKKAAFRSELERLQKKSKMINDKQRRIQMGALKSKNKERFDPMYFDIGFESRLQSESMENFIKQKNLYKSELIRSYMETIRSRHEQLYELLKNLIFTRFGHLLDYAALERTQLCLSLDLILQQRYKSDQKEISLSTKYMSEQEENLKREHARELRELPKQSRVNLKKSIDAYKKSLKNIKNKSEKETLIAEKQNELISVIDHEFKMRKEQQNKELNNLIESNARQIQEIQDYQAEKNKSAHSSFQEQLYKVFLQDERKFKLELIKLYQVKKSFDQEYETEVSVASTLDISGFSVIEPEMF